VEIFGEKGTPYALAASAIIITIVGILLQLFAPTTAQLNLTYYSQCHSALTIMGSRI